MADGLQITTQQLICASLLMHGWTEIEAGSVYEYRRSAQKLRVRIAHDTLYLEELSNYYRRTRWVPLRKARLKHIEVDELGIKCKLWRLPLGVRG